MTDNSRLLTNHITEALAEWNRDTVFYPKNFADSERPSAVLFLLSECPQKAGLLPEPCIVFNKRSKLVRQAGDLCFPGGGIAPLMDSLGARLLGLPFSPLGRWPYWKEWRNSRKEEAARLSLLLATGLRESLEEMRLNPWGVTFLGPMPAKLLQPFQRLVYPLVFWITNQKRFFPNREVEKVVSIPINDLLNPGNYVCYRMYFESAQIGNSKTHQDFPGFLHDPGEEKEVLWGVTYRMVIHFLKIIFDFSPPEMDSLAVVEGCRGKDYFAAGPKV